jgi:hypothetical protein
MGRHEASPSDTKQHGSPECLVCYTGGMDARQGPREPRQDASDLVRRPEDRDAIGIIVTRHLAAPDHLTTSQRWTRWNDIADLFHGPADARWQRDRDLVDQTVASPWDRR